MSNLRPNRRQLLKRAGVLGALAAFFSPAAAFAQSNASTQSLGGSWHVSLTPQGAGTPAPFDALHTFTGDGAVTTAEQRDQIPPTLTSPGHGTWTKLPSNDGPDDFSYSYQKLVVDTQGNLVGMMIVKAKIELTNGGQSFKGTGSVVLQPITQPTPAPDYIIMIAGNRI